MKRVSKKFVKALEEMDLGEDLGEATLTDILCAIGGLVDDVSEEMDHFESVNRSIVNLAKGRTLLLRAQISIEKAFKQISKPSRRKR